MLATYSISLYFVGINKSQKLLLEHFQQQNNSRQPDYGTLYPVVVTNIFSSTQNIQIDRTP